VVTANADQNSSKVFEAMGAGALDAVNTPTLEDPRAANGAAALLGKIQVIQRLIGDARGKNARGEPLAPALTKPGRRPQLVAIGASAGGPAALGVVLSHLPEEFPASVVVVQHVDAKFAGGLAAWLGQETRLRVRLAGEGDHPQPGRVLLAGTENHLVFVSPGKLGYSARPLDCLYRPSVDVFFRSIQRYWRGDVIGIILTGMGRDGAEGLEGLRRAGQHTIAQDRASSAVFGMPKAAIEMAAASEVLPLKKIGPRVAELVKQRMN
jgi:two-component system response regulator WspF